MTDGIDFDNLSDEDKFKMYENLVEEPETMMLAKVCFNTYAGSNAAGDNSSGSACLG